MKTYHIQNTKQKERLVLGIYIVYTVCMMVMAYLQKWHYLIPQVALAGLAASIFFYARQYKSYYFRAFFTSCMIWLNCIFFACHSSNILGLISTICSMVVLIGVYGICEMVYLGAAGILFLMCYDASSIKEMYLGLAQGERIRVLLHLASVFLTIYVVYCTAKQQEESNGNLADTIDNLKKAQQSKNDFMANISHEIRTPINAVCGISEVVMRDRELPDKARRDILDIQTAGRHLSSIISDILDFSELEAGKMELAEEPYNITSTVNDVINMAVSKNSEKGLELIVDCDATIPCSLLGDEQKIRRVIMNIVDNAIKFTKNGGVLISVTARKEAYGVNLLVTVSDTGIGMNEEELENLFTSFSQVNASRNRIEGGIGLGLAISQAIVEKMEGFINVHSVAGKGSMVQFVVPQKVLDESPIISIKNPESLRVIGYINMEKYSFSLLREGYASTVRNIVRTLGLNFIQCRTLAELKRRVEKERFSHIFISFDEYCEDKGYFEKLSLSRTVVLVLDREDGEAEDLGGNILPLYKPFYVLPVASVLNEEDVVQNMDGSRYRGRQFIAPDAKVLVVDDSPMNLRVVDGLLRPYKIQLETADSGKEALKKIEDQSYDFVFMDHMMPEMDGVEALRLIRRKPGQYFKTVPVIALTANAIGGAREMFIEEGFADFVAKPVETSVLERVLRRYIPKEKQLKIEGATEEKAQPAQVKEQPTEEKTQPAQVKEQPTEEKTQPAQVKEQPIEAPIQDICLDGIDVALGLGFCGGDISDYVEVVKIYHSGGLAKRNEIRKAYEEKDWKTYTIHAHSVKSMSMGIGAVALSNMAKELEAAGKARQEDYISAHNDEMLAEYERILGIIGENSVIFPEKAQTRQDLPEIPKDKLVAELEILTERLETFEPDGVQEVLERLLGYQFEGAALDCLLGGIKSKVDAFDFMGAGEEAASITEKMR